MKSILAKSKSFFLLSFISSILLLGDYLHILDLPKKVITVVSVPIQYGLYKTVQATNSQLSFIFAARFAAKENKALKGQLGDLLSENANLRRRLAEDEAMLDQANSLSPRTFNLLPARPIGINRFLLLDKGSTSSVKVGEVVVFKDNFIGIIKQVEPNLSRVVLGQDPDSKIAVFTQNAQGRSKGILSGQFGAEELMDKILHDEKIQVGDLVYSDGTEGILPRGLILGKVTQVLERQNELFKQAKIKPLFNFSDLDLVFVIKGE